MDKQIVPAANRGREDGQKLEVNGTECSNALTTVGKDSVVVEKVTKVLGRMEGYEMANRVYSAEGTAPALRTFQGGGLEPKIVVENGFFKQAVETAEVVGGLGEKKSNGGTQYYQQDRVLKGDVAQALAANLPGGSNKYCVQESRKWRIRKLTPRECGRLMAVSDSDIDKMEAVNSNSQLFKQFGNSIVVDVLKALFLQMNIQGIKNWNERLEERRNAKGA